MNSDSQLDSPGRVRQFLSRVKPTGSQVTGAVGIVTGAVAAWVAYLIIAAKGMTDTSVLFAGLMGVVALGMVVFGLVFLITRRDPDNTPDFRMFRPFWSKSKLV